MPPLEILYECKDFFVLNKPSQVHSVAGRSCDSIEGALRERFPALRNLPDAGLIHRLDFETSGCLCVAQNAAAYERLRKDFASHEVTKTYLCAIEGRLSDGSLEAYFRSRYRGSKKISVFKTGSAKEHGKILWKTLCCNGKFQTLHVELVGPGKRHQIRASFASLGHPLLGDRLYGSSVAFPGLALHAYSLEVGRIEIKCPIPASWIQFKLALST